MELDQETIEAIADGILPAVVEITDTTMSAGAVIVTRIVVTAHWLDLDLRALASVDVCRAIRDLRPGARSDRVAILNRTRSLRRAIERIGRERYPQLNSAFSFPNFNE